MRILLCEDNDDDAELLRRHLRRSYGDALEMTVVSALDELTAALVASFDVVVCDMRMPKLSIDEVIAELRARSLDYPVISLSGVFPEDQISDIIRGGNIHDFVSKDRLARLVPAIDREVVAAAVREQGRAADARILALVTVQVQMLDATIAAWSHIEEQRDPETAGHVHRVTELVVRFAKACGITDPDELRSLRWGAALHDVGKIGVSDRVLLKTSALTEDEWAEMRSHPQLAYDWLAPFFLPFPSLRPVLDIPYCHHERWDGTGYPRGLQGEDIPLSARLATIADVYDALRIERRYREAWDLARVLAYIKAGAGTQFDPQAVGTFVVMMRAQEAQAVEAAAPT